LIDFWRIARKALLDIISKNTVYHWTFFVISINIKYQITFIF